MATWAHDSSGISSLDAVVSTNSSHLTRTMMDQHIGAHSSLRLAATSAPNAFLSLSHILVLGLCKNPKMLQQALDHLPRHLLEVVFQNMARVWPPASLCQSTVPAPFALWLRSAAFPTDAHSQVYDGLVLSDVEELQQISTTQAGTVTTLLDLATDKVTDETCLAIKNTVGKTVKALRISSPALTDLGLRKMTASIPDSFQQLTCFSLYGSSQITDRGLLELVKFPNLSFIDLRGTSCTSAAVKMASRPSTWSTPSPVPFHAASPNERLVVRPDVPLAESYKQLHAKLAMSGPEPQVVVTQLKRTLQLGSIVDQERRKPLKDTFTPAFGRFYSTAALSREVLLQDAADKTSKGKAFRSNFGGEVAGGATSAPVGRMKPYSFDTHVGLLKRLEMWSSGQWDDVRAKDAQRQAVADGFFGGQRGEGSAQQDLGGDERLLGGPVLIRRLPPQSVRQVPHQAAPAKLAPSKHQSRFGKPIPEPVKIRHQPASTSRSSATASTPSMASLLGMSSAQDDRAAKRARLDKILPPSRTETQSMSPGPRRASQASSSPANWRTPIGGLNQKRASLNAFRKRPSQT